VAIAILTVLLAVPASGALAAPVPAPGQTPGITADPYGNLSAFYQDANTGHLIQLHKFLDQPWTGPFDLGGLVTSGATGMTNQRTDSYRWVFARGGNDAVYYRRQYSGGASWEPWQTAGGTIIGTPSASCLGEQTTPPILWVRAIDNSLYRKVLTGGWQRVGGVLASEPSAVPPAMGACPPHDDVYLLGTNHVVYEYVGGRFHPVGGQSTVAPAAVRFPNGATWLFTRGTDRALWLRTRTVDNGAWSANWLRLGGSLDSAPAATLFQDRATVVARFIDGSLHEGHFANGVWIWSAVN
jgi:hypothetical protein